MEEGKREAVLRLIKWLQSFLEMEKAGNVELDQWASRVQEFRAFLNMLPFLHDCVDENIWHYLSDIDIRLKKGEEEYRQMHIEQLKNSLRALTEHASS